MQVRVSDSITAISPADWNGLLNNSNPFLTHEFLHALEASGSVSEATGWQPLHLTCLDEDDNIVGALPLYLKSNSYGEFVFDFAWASAYHQAGLEYYPKLVTAVPFTPAGGARLLVSDQHPQRAAVVDALVKGAIELAQTLDASSWHVLFPQQSESADLERANLLLRKDCQFHWHNQNYADFDEFLQTFTSVKRKKVRRERRRISEAGLHFEVASGADLSETDWDELLPLYRTTFLRRGREPYLDRDFFLRISELNPDCLVVFRGYEKTELVAVAICFRSDTHLYGRYWGANRFIDSLHFETCYYQGIDYCISENLQCFEPGTQGEHKISRGFVPTETWSAHWLSHPQFAQAIDDYLTRERRHIERYMDVLGDHVPYRQSDEL